MATVAELRMDVDSRPVKNAGRDLDQLASKAERTERAANKLGDGSRRAGRGVQSLAREAQDAGRSVGGMDADIGRAIGRLAGFAAGIIGVVGALRGMAAGLRAADEFKALDNRIKLVTDSAAEFAKVQTGLIDISRRTFASIEGTVQAYQRMAGATDRLGISQDRLLGIAETVNKAVALSGATSQAAEASLIQFGQALSNNFQASSQEINSLNEQVFALSDAIARGITKVTGIETFRSDLKRLAEDGKLSSELVIRALEAVKDETDATFNGLDRTFAQIAQRLKTNAQVIAKEAFGPLLNIKIDFATKLAAALEDPKTIAAATRFGATLADLARGVERNASAIGKAFQGIAAGAGVLAAVAAVQALRSAVLALGVAVTANPLGLLITGIAAAVAVIITFRDEITRALTPFGSFKELASETGTVVKGAFSVAGDAATILKDIFLDLKKAVEDTLNIITRALSVFPEVQAAKFAFEQQRKNGGVNIASSVANAAIPGFSLLRSGAASAVGVFRSRGEFEESVASRQTTFESVLARYKTGAKEATEETLKIGEAANDASKFWGSLSGEAENTAKKIEKARIEAEKARKALASDVASTAYGFQISDALDPFARIDFSRLSQGQKDAALDDFQSTIEGLSKAIESDADISAQERAHLLGGLADISTDFLEKYGKKNDDHIDGFAAAIQSVTGSLLDDLLFNGGRGLGDLFKSALRDIGNSAFVNPIAKALSGEGSLLGNLKTSFSKLTENFGKAGSQIAGTISKSLAGAGAALGAALGGALAGFGVGNGLGDVLGLSKGSTGRRTLTGAATGAGVGFAVAGPIGAAVGAIAGALAGAISGLFGRKTSTGTIDLASGDISGLKNSKKEGGARTERRDAILENVSSIAQTFADALGATITKGINLQVSAGKSAITTTLTDASGRTLGTASAGKDDVEGALNNALKLIIDKAFSGGNQTLKDFANSAIAAGRSIEEVVAVLQVLKDVTDSGKKALADYALVAAKAGRSADQIVKGVNALADVYALTEKPLSEIAEQIKRIDDAINPVIEDLKSLGQSFADIARIGREAGQALGENFIQSIRDLNIDLQNSVFGQFNKLLQEIRQREEDATALFQRGFISEQQLGFVKSTSGLQVSNFFKGLSDDDKESLADFLGLLKTASGDIAVARVKLEEQFNYLIDNVEETARNFEDAARTFERLAQNLTQTADAIRTEFSGLTPRDNTVTLQGRVQTLLGQARDETASTQSRQSALEALPQVVNALVQSARQAFGGTEQFASIRDFGLAALDEGATLADNLAKFNQQQADAAREDVKLLTDIRELINDDRQLPTLQAILDEGKLTNTLIAQQLQTFLNLMATAGSNLNQITAEQLQAAAAAYLAQQQQAISQASSSTQTASTQTTATPALSATTTDQQLAQALADQAAATDKNSAAILRMEQTIDDLATEIRRTTLRQVA